MPVDSEDGHSTSGASGSGIGGSQLFVQHTVTRLDSLVGLAVKYNVTVSDIKRANSLLSDSAMFARDTLLIPTRPLPIGSECSAMAGMILTQYGQISREHSRHRTAPSFDSGPGASRQGQAANAIEQLRAHYGLTPQGSPDPASRRGSVEYTHSEDGASQRRGEVEMQDMGDTHSMGRPPSLPDLTSYAGEKGGPAVDERLRRRRAQERAERRYADGAADPDSRRPQVDSGSSPPENVTEVFGPGRPPLLPSSSVASTSGMRGSRLGSGGPLPAPGRRRESFFQKVKRAASLPALAGPAGPSLNSAAEGAIASTKSQGAGSSVLQQAAAAVQGPKACSKKE